MKNKAAWSADRLNCVKKGLKIWELVLGHLLNEEKGTSLDWPEYKIHAYAWLNLAASNNERPWGWTCDKKAKEYAQKYRDDLNLSSSYVIQAQNLSEQFKAWTPESHIEGASYLNQ